MIFSKPENKKYTQMCMEFDEEFYKPNRDDGKLFKYMYLMFYMWACKGNYFRKFEDFDGYAQYAATKLYTRYLKKEKNGLRIKSLRNYTQSCKNRMKIDYQKETFEQVTQKGDKDVLTFEQAYRDNLRASYSRQNIFDDMNELLKKFPAIATQVINESPYKNDAKLCKHIYQSCLLTFLSSITLTNNVIDRLASKQESKVISDNYVIKQYQKNLEESLILWNLDSDYSDVVLLLVNKIRSKMSEEINGVISANMIPDDVIDSIIASAYDEKAYTSYDEASGK